MKKLDTHLYYENKQLFLGAKGTSLFQYSRNYRAPLYIYDLDLIQNRYKSMSSFFPKAEIYYAMKANPNLDVLKKLKSCGSRVDVVSLGEIRRALQAGFRPEDIIFSGVGKTENEIKQAILIGIHQINVESVPELHRIIQLSKAQQKCTPVALRLNPNIDIKTHPYIATGLHENKFGMEISLLPEIEKVLIANRGFVSLVGVSLHLGSQMHDFSGFRDALKLLRPQYEDLQSKFPTLVNFDIGGGLGIYYEEINPIKELEQLSLYSQIVSEELKDLRAVIQTEPGRWLVGHAGVLLTQIQYVKETGFKSFLVVDSGMTHLLRPALYHAYHSIYPLVQHPERTLKQYDIVGPICESADFFAKDRRLHESLQGEYLAVADVGAYGFSMASTYNLQELPEEICI